MTFILVITVICGIGLGLSLFFGIHLLRFRELKYTILGILLVVLSLRIAKSVFYNFVDLPLYIKNLGLAANLAVGPLLYLYGRSLLTNLNRLSAVHLLHFIPSLIYIIFCDYIPNDFKSSIWRLSYSFILIQSFTYVAISLFVLNERKHLIEKKLRDWYLLLCTSLTTVWIVYTLIFLKILPIYAAGPVAFSVLVFVVSVLAFGRSRGTRIRPTEKYPNSKITIEEGKLYLNRIKKAIEEEHLYLDAELSLTKLSAKLDLSARDISLVINRHANKNFSSFINEYRIEEAKKLLISSQKNTKILAIAIDSGFNNLSSFNVAFKALTRSTPSEYRAKHTLKITD